MSPALFRLWDFTARHLWLAWAIWAASNPNLGLLEVTAPAAFLWFAARGL